MLRRFALAVLCAAPAFAGTVEGIVRNSATGAPLSGARITLEGANALTYTASTDAQGGFRIDDVKPGTYTARYFVRDFIEQPGTSHSFAVAISGAPVSLQVSLTPIGKWSGRVIDGRRVPVAKARVEVIGLDRVLLSTMTDIDGKFEIRQLPFIPGPFTLSAIPPSNWKPPDPEPCDGRTFGWTRTYYPGVALAEAASNVEQTPGIDLAGIEIKLLAVPTHTVHGVLLDADGSPAAGITVSAGENLRIPRFETESLADGTFELPAVVDGQWHLWAESEVRGVKLRADQWIEIGGHDAPPVRLQLTAPFAVHGSIVIEPRGTLPAPKPPSVRIDPSPHGAPATEPGIAARPADDGVFTLQNVYPGSYRLAAAEPPGYYLDAVRLGEAPLAAPEFELSSGALPLTLLYKTNGGLIRGQVENCASRGVLLFPRDPAMRWPAFLRTASCDSAGHYEFTALRPGEYYAVVFSGFVPPWFSPGFDTAMLNRSVQLTVCAGETTTAPTLR